MFSGLLCVYMYVFNYVSYVDVSENVTTCIGMCCRGLLFMVQDLKWHDSSLYFMYTCGCKGDVHMS